MQSVILVALPPEPRDLGKWLSRSFLKLEITLLGNDYGRRGYDFRRGV
jgi:hypothetical protein